MWRKVSCIVLVFTAIVVTQGDNLFNEGNGGRKDTGSILPGALGLEGLLKAVESGELSQPFEGTFYDIRSNETGLFNGSGNGTWIQFGYSTWMVKGNEANVSIYTIENFNLVPENVTYLLATYVNAQLLSSKHVVHWNKTTNSRLMLRNETLAILSNTCGNGTGYLELMSSTSARYSENITQHVNRTKDGKITNWHGDNSGVINTFENFTSILGFARGISGVDDVGEVAEPSRETLPDPTPLDELIGNTFKFSGASANWAERYNVLVFGNGKTRAFNLTSDRLLDDYDLGKPITESRNSTGYIWDNVYSLNMGLPKAFDSVLPAFLEILF